LITIITIIIITIIIILNEVFSVSKFSENTVKLLVARVRKTVKD